MPAGLFKQVQGLQLLLADNPRTIGYRSGEHSGEDFVRYFAAQRIEQLQFVGIRQLASRQRCVGEHALLADVQVAHHLPVAPLVVPQHAQRLAHAAVLELRLVEVEYETLGNLRFGRAQVRALQAAIVQLCAVVAQGVGGGGKLAVIVVATAFEHLPRHLGVTEVLDAQLVKIVAAPAGRPVACPPGRVSFEGDAAAVVDAPDAVWPAANWLVETRTIGEIALLPVMFG